MHDIKIGFYGMTHLGLISAVAAASKQFQVIGYDTNNDLVQRLQMHQFPVEEPQLRELASAYTEYLQFSSSLEALLAADIIYVAIDVPTNDNNESDLQPIQQALQQLRDCITVHHIVVVLSQVSPGFTRRMQLPSSQLFYQVETLIFGRAIERATQPERFIIGCAQDLSLPIKFKKFLSTFECPILPMRYESAELAKISINMYLVASVMTTNMLAELAAAVGADWFDIVPTLQLDKRIGPHAYLSPGLGISGGNLERDMATIIRQASVAGTHAQLVETWLAESRYYQQWIWRHLQSLSYSTVAIWGIAYKANTHSIKNSPAVKLITQLQQNTDTTIRVYDPLVPTNAVPGIHYCDTARDATVGADILIVMHTPVEHKKLMPTDLKGVMQGRIIIDPFRVLDHMLFKQSGFTIFTLGTSVGDINQSELKRIYHV